MCIYNAADYVRFVIHTHSFYAALYSIYGETLYPYVTGTAEAFNDGVPCLGFSADRAVLAASLEATIATGCQACLLERHGALVWGNSWSQALNFAELLEWSARMAVAARCAGLSAMSSSQIAEYSEWYNKNYQRT
jgi:L-fuculose-phosphate aldolase